MGTVAEKLSYLADTKDLFRDRLNSLGAEITSSTTFRNYLTWLNTFYGEVSDKTDLSQNGVVGRTSQESTIGINIFNVNSHYVLSDGYSINDEDWLTNTYDNSQGVEHYENIWCRATSLLETSTNYLIVCEIKSVSGSGILYPYTKHSSSAIDTQHSSYSFSSLSPGQKILIPVTTKSSFSGLSCDLRTLVRYNEGNNGSITFRLSLLTDTSITSDTFVYEPFTNGASPNPDFPQPINNLSGDVAYNISGKNKIPTNISNWESGQYNVSGTKQDMASRIRLKELLPIKPNTTYYFDTFDTTEFSLIHNFIIRECNENGDFINNAGIINNQETFTTRNDAYYLMVTIGTSSTTSGEAFENYQTYFNEGKLKPFICLDSEIDKSYEPYIEPQTFNIPLKSKNLFDKNTTNKLNGYFERSGDTIHSSGANRVFYLECKPNTTYAFTQGETNISNHVFQVASTIEKPDIGVVVENFADRSGYSSYKTFTYTTNANAKYLVIRLRSSDTTNEFLDGVQIEENNEVTSYEPYYDIELCDIDTYEDKIYSSNGRFYLEKKTGKVVLDGSESWTTIQAYGRNYYAVNISNLLISDSATNDALLYNNYYIGYKSSELVGNNTKDYGICRRNNNSQVLFRDKDHSTLSSLTTWLGTHNNIMYYPLATPTTTEITQENYPSLYNALKQIQDYLTAYKINKEFILGYSSPEIEY